MDVFFNVAAGVIMAVSMVAFLRVVIGRTIFDQVLAAGAVGTNTVALMAVIGFIFDRPDMFIDLALTYALLNFVVTVAAAKLLEQRGQGTP